MPMKRVNFITAIVLCGLTFASCTTESIATQPTSKPNVSPSLTETPFPTITHTETETSKPACQPIESSTNSIDGGLLFYEREISNLDIITRVWLWSANTTSPQLVLEKVLPAQIYLSPDGRKLVWHQYDSDNFTTYDLISKKYENYPWKTEWQTITGWTKDGRVSILVDYKDIFGKGVTRIDAYFDVQTQSFMTEVFSLDLPGFTEGESSRDPQDGFAVKDPTNSLVLYTSNEGSLGKLILMDIKSGQRLWEETAQYPFYPYPDWTSDGDQVTFALYKDNHSTIYTLTRDGQTSKDIGEGIPPRVIREIKWSPDTSYIYYAYWDTVQTGPAYLINVVTKETKEICTSDYDFLNGYWRPNNQIAYIVYKGEQDQPGIAELRILDVKNWTGKTVFQTATNKNQLDKLNFLGWIPLINP